MKRADKQEQVQAAASPWAWLASACWICWCPGWLPCCHWLLPALLLLLLHERDNALPCLQALRLHAPQLTAKLPLPVLQGDGAGWVACGIPGDQQTQPKGRAREALTACRPVPTAQLGSLCPVRSVKEPQLAAVSSACTLPGQAACMGGCGPGCAAEGQGAAPPPAPRAQTPPAARAAGRGRAPRPAPPGRRTCGSSRQQRCGCERRQAQTRLRGRQGRARERVRGHFEAAWLTSPGRNLSRERREKIDGAAGSMGRPRRATTALAPGQQAM